MNAETALSLVRADEAIIRFAALHSSAIGTKRTFVFASHMSAWDKADVVPVLRNVRL